jgi:predicted O-methyltransferase YrrM
MPVPRALRRLAPDALRDDPRLRALALGLGVIPPRPMNSEAEMAVLARLARSSRCVVELGVYEGSSAVVLCRALDAGDELHLIDPFLAGGNALREGHRANRTATRLAVRRAAGRDGPTIHWHIARSQDVGREWQADQVDLVFVDGDHSLGGARQDWEVWHPHVRSGGWIAFHDARLGQPGGSGHPGPSAVVDELFRDGRTDWKITDEVDSLVVVQRA